MLVGLQEVENEGEIRVIAGYLILLIVAVWYFVVDLVQPVITDVHNQVRVALGNNRVEEIAFVVFNSILNLVFLLSKVAHKHAMTDLLKLCKSSGRQLLLLGIVLKDVCIGGFQ